MKINRAMVRAGAVVFIASFCTLVIELVAGRVLAPWVGVSLYTWTSIIGVVLAGISAGAWAGGVLADRRGTPRLLALLLFLSGLSAFAIVPLSAAISSGRILATAGESLLARVLVLSGALFFLPSFLLGMISPLAVKLALTDLRVTGNVVGKIYAFSTLGSILGTFATGFFLISWLGVRALLLSVGLVLVASAVLFAFSSRKGQLVAATLAIVFLTVGSAFLIWAGDLRQGGGEFVTESNYYTIRVREQTRIDGGGKLQTLVLDHLVHSLNDLNDPCYLAYGYLRVFREAVESSFTRRPRKFLFLGGGGYTLPRCLEQTIPQAMIEVVEIDPEVSRVASMMLGVPKDARIRTWNEDARWFVMNSRQRYDFIFADAFNDLSIPYQLTTLEFAEQLHRILDSRGVLMANVIDNVPRGDFLPSYIRTLELVFGPEAVRLFVDRDTFSFNAQGTVVVVAAKDRQAIEEFARRIEGEGFTAAELPKHILKDAYARDDWLVLTDDHAPVDNLLAPLFAQRLRYRRK